MTKAPRLPTVDPIDLTVESIGVFGFDRVVTAWNAAAARLFGWTKAQMIGQRLDGTLGWNGPQDLDAALVNLERDGTWSGEIHRLAKTGERVIVQATWTLRRDEAGEPLDIVEVSQDVTAARQSTEVLARAQNQYRNLFEASAAAFWELDLRTVEGIVAELMASGVSDLRAYFKTDLEFLRRLLRATPVLDINDQALAMFGRGDRTELMSSLEAVWPEESLGLFGESIATAFEHSRSLSSTSAVLQSLDGRRYDTIFTVSYPPELFASKLLVCVIDVTEAKKARAAEQASKRRYHEFFQYLPISLWQLDGNEVEALFSRARAEGAIDLLDYMRTRPHFVEEALQALKVDGVNPRSVELFKARSVDDFVGPIARYWSESPEIFARALAACYAGDRDFQAQVKMRANDGTLIDALFFVAFGSVTGDRNLSLMGLIDVTDRVKAEDMLAHVQAEIAHAARVSLLGELTASIAHEVSQPLTVITTNTEATQLWLERSPPDVQEALKLTSRTAAEARRAGDIIDRIRAMATRAVPEQRPTEINSLIEEALPFLRTELQRYDVQTITDLGQDVPSIQGDRVQLQQVVVNLAMNAIQAMASSARQTRRLTIRTRATSDNILVEVLDTGPGVAPEVMEKLFDSFFTTKDTGMGIGLPICRSIIEAHGGQITVSNRARQAGANFTIRLPVHQVQSAPLEAEIAPRALRRARS